MKKEEKLQYASEELKNDKEVVLAAVKQSSYLSGLSDDELSYLNQLYEHESNKGKEVSDAQKGVEKEIEKRKALKEIKGKLEETSKKEETKKKINRKP